MSESEINTRVAPQRDGGGDNTLNIYAATETLIKEVCNALVIVHHFRTSCLIPNLLIL